MRCGAGLARPLIVRLAFLLVALVASYSLFSFWHLAADQAKLPHVISSAIGHPPNTAANPPNTTAAVTPPGAAATPSQTGNAAQVHNPGLGPRNSTLGFDVILALSKGGQTWRVQGLQAAGALTGVQVTIPPQPSWSKEMVEAFAALGPEGVQKPGVGSATAWLAHIDLLKYVIQGNFNSALIVEDDVDWDVNIKDQLSRAAETVRKHTKASFEEGNPYSSLWDVLWLGHCGDIPRDNETFTFFSDPTVIRHSQYEGFAAGYVGDHFPEGQRAVYRSQGAICSYAYAVNKQGIRKVLEYVSQGQEQAFDTKLFHGCRSGSLNCISVNPELFRHFQPDKKFGQTSEVDKQNWGGEEKIKHDTNNDKGSPHVSGTSGQPQFDVAKKIVGITNNIRESARCKALWNKKCIGKQGSFTDMIKNMDIFGRR
ncbi:glycosyltransferase family 25 protein [Apiospora kogelbergensis]|uniref:Glycosyltransferase family 25 protein n=1 Tax=Apiospora kogelbergensis TaxID=1337665 RepID=A0AAW0Q766_9PEZI